MFQKIQTLLKDKPDDFAREVLTEALCAHYRRSLFSLARTGLGFRDVTDRTHGPIIRALEDPAKRKLICVPRGCLKSTIACVAYPIWLLINNPNLRILIDSELYTNSATFLRQIKAHLEDPKLTALFGSFKSKCWNSGEIIISQRTDNTIKEASIICGGVGTTKVGQHYDVIICDDMNSKANTENSDMAQKVIDHYRLNISILEPDGIYVVIGTRYGALDLIGHILDNEPNDHKEVS